MVKFIMSIIEPMDAIRALALEKTGERKCSGGIGDTILKILKSHKYIYHNVRYISLMSEVFSNNCMRHVEVSNLIGREPRRNF